MDLNELKDLLQLLDDKQIAEFELEEEGMKLRIRKGVSKAAHLPAEPPAPAPLPTQVAAPQPSVPPAASAPAPAAVAEEAEAGLTVVKSPIVGTFYRASDPNSPPFVQLGDRVRVGELEAEVWETPGHCLDHVAYWFAGAEIVFAGDTLFTLGCGRVMESPPETLWRSLQRFDRLPDATQVFSGHDYVLSNARFALAAEPDNAALRARAAEAERAAAEGRFLVPSSMGAERDTNPFLRAREPALARAVDLPQGDSAAVFVALRAWKNRF